MPSYLAVDLHFVIIHTLYCRRRRYRHFVRLFYFPLPTTIIIILRSVQRIESNLGLSGKKRFITR